MAGLNNIREAYEQVYAPQEEIEEGLRSAVKRLLDGGKKEAEAPKPQSRGAELRRKYNVGSERSDTSAKRQILDRSRARAERDEKEFGGSKYSKTVAQKSKAAHDRYLKAGYSKYGADDARGSGNKARKRAAALNREEFEFIVNALIDEGYDLSSYTWDEMYEICLDEALSADEKALRRELVRDKKASQMAPSVAAKYAGSEAQSAARADKKSRGKHIYGMADSYEVDGDIVDETTRKPSQIAKRQKLTNLLQQIQDKNEKARKDIIATQAHKDMVKAASRHFEEVELSERELDPTETREKERLVKGLKKSAGDFKKRYGARAKSVMYATATKMAKERMDTSKSDRRYAVER